MRDDRFEWDDAKAASNARKHHVTFEQAAEAFDDPFHVEEPEDDPDEHRWRLVGKTSAGILLVIHTERDDRTRIISARRATRHEQASYYRQARP